MCGMASFRASTWVGFSLALLCACSSDADPAKGASPEVEGGAGTSAFAGNTGASGSGTTPPADCEARCVSKVGACGVGPPSEISSGCAKLCNSVPATIVCFESHSCGEIFGEHVCDDAGSGGRTGQGGSGTGASGGKGGSAGGGKGGSASGGKGGSTATSCEPAHCEGNKAVSCDDSGGFPVMISTLCLEGCASGMCLGKPKVLTISGSFGSATKPYSTTGSSGDIITITTIEAQNAVPSPKVSDPPKLDKLVPKILSPALGGCDPKVLGNLSVGSAWNVITQLSSVEKAASTPCLAFQKKVTSSGLKVQFVNVPYLNGGTADSVTIDLKP